MAIGFPVKANYVTGEVLTAANMNDLSGSVNLLTSAQYAAGKNKIINGDFNINQRNFTSTTTNDTYGFDRWIIGLSGGTVTYSTQNFTAGAAPVAGYEGKSFARVVTSGQSAAGDYATLEQRIEDVRNFAGQTITISLWAKAASGTPNLAFAVNQNFGSGGSAQVVNATSISTITTSWVRYSFTIAVPSISGKTIGTGSYISIRPAFSIGSTISGLGYPAIGIQNNTFDIWGVQAESGSTATSFQTATGTLQGELAACQRYYYRLTADTTYSYLAFGMATSTTNGKVSIPAPSTMRVVPTAIDSPTASTLRFTDGVSGTTCNASPTLDADTTNELLTFNVGVASGLTQYRPIWFGANNSSSAYIGFSAEL
jgi:hypothetical protein